jgi:hypothetical protein
MRKSKPSLRDSFRRPCKSLKRSGGECRTGRVTGSDYCFFHDPNRKAERKAAQSTGGQKNRMAVLPNSTPDVTLRSAGDELKLLEDTINQVRRGEIDPKIANVIGYLCALRTKTRHEFATERRLSILEAAIKRNQASLIYEADGDDDPEWNVPTVEETNGND